MMTMAPRFRGLGPVTQTTAVSQFLYFYIFEAVKLLRLVERVRGGGVGEQSGPSALDSFLGSLIAGVLNMAVTEPLWRANVHCQVELKKHSARSAGVLPLRDSANSPLKALHQQQSSSRAESQPRSQAAGDPEASSQNVFRVVLFLARRDGWASLWRGLTTSLWLVSNPMIQYALYDVLKARVGSGRHRSVSAFQGFLLGALTKAIATVFTYPLQVTQTRMRSAKFSAKREAAPAGVHGGAPNTAAEGKSFAECFREVYNEEEGWGAYFKGIGPKMIQTVLHAALMFYFYEAILRMARKALVRR